MTREKFLSLGQSIRAVEVEGGVVHVRPITIAERFAWRAGMKDEDEQHNFLSLLACCICDESGTRLFSDSAEDLSLLAQRPFAVLDVIGKEALSINGMGEAATGIAKNS